MGIHIQLELKAIEQAAAASGAEGIDLRAHLAGLVLMYHHVWSKKTDGASRELLMGWFAVGPQQVDRLAAGLVAFGHLVERGAGWRIRGAGRYESLRAKLSQGGHAAKGNLRQFKPERAPATEETAEKADAPAHSSAPARGSRSLSDKEECWENMERSRVEHCERLGLAPGKCQRPKLCNTKIGEALKAAGIAEDNIIGGQHLTACDYLCLLFEQYLQDELGRVDERNGELREPPWPLPLFLHPNVLERFKHDFEAAA